MSARGFIILLLATVVALVVGIVAAVQPTISSTDLVAGDPMFPALAQEAASARTVTVQTPQYTTTWEQRDGIWVSPERGNYPAKANIVSDLVAGLSRLTKVEAKTAQPDWYRYIRVGDPAATPPTGIARVTVAGEGEQLADTILGARSFSIAASHMRGGMFVREPDEAQSWLVEGSISVPTELGEWFDTVIDIPGTDIASVAIFSGDKVDFEARKTDLTTASYEIVRSYPPAGDNVANSNSIRNLTSAIVGVRVEDVRAASSLDTEANVRTVRFTTTAGLQLDARIVEADGRNWAIFAATAPEGGEAAAAAEDINSRTAGWAFLLNESLANRLNQPVADLMQAPGSPSMDGIAPLPLDQNGRPIFDPPGGVAPQAPIPGAQVLPNF